MEGTKIRRLREPSGGIDVAADVNCGAENAIRTGAAPSPKQVTGGVPFGDEGARAGKSDRARTRAEIRRARRPSEEINVAVMVHGNATTGSAATGRACGACPKQCAARIILRQEGRL